MDEHPTTKLAREIIEHRDTWNKVAPMAPDDRERLARRLLALEAVADAARRYYKAPKDMAARTALFLALENLAPLDKLKEGR